MKSQHGLVLRRHEPRVDGQVHRAQGGRPKDTSPDPEVAQGGCVGGRPVEGTPLGAVISPLLANV